MAVTPKRAFSTAPGLGLVTTLQRPPFQCSINAWPKVLRDPTAQTSLAETAVTLKSKLFNELKRGLVTTLHCMPFQCSTSGCSDAPVVIPTAQTSRDEMAATPER